MRISATPSYWNEEAGLDLVEVQDITMRLSPDELEKLAAFLIELAKTARETGVVDASIDFEDSKPTPQTGIWLNVLCE